MCFRALNCSSWTKTNNENLSSSLMVRSHQSFLQEWAFSPWCLHWKSREELLLFLLLLNADVVRLVVVSGTWQRDKPDKWNKPGFFGLPEKLTMFRDRWVQFVSDWSKLKPGLICNVQSMATHIWCTKSPKMVNKTCIATSEHKCFGRGIRGSGRLPRSSFM